LKAKPSEGMEGTKPEQARRSDRRMALFLCVVSLFSILIVSVAWYTATLNPVLHEKSCQGYLSHESPFSHFPVPQLDGNWTLTSTCYDKDFHLSEITMTMRNSNGSIVNPMRQVMLTNLTEENWAIYHVMYLKVGDEDYVRQGARIVIDATRYPSGYRYELVDQYTIISNGVLG